MVKEISKSVFFLYCIFLFSSCYHSVNKDDETIQEAAQEFNKSCPFQTDNLTTLDSVVYKSPKTIVFYSTTNVNLVKSNINAIKAILKSKITYHTLDSQSNSFKVLKDIGASFNYVYKTQNGKEFLNVTFDPDFYLKKESNHSDNLTDSLFYETLEEVAHLINSQLPRQLEEGILLYHVNAIRPRSIEYTYRFESPIEDIDTAYLRSIEFKEGLIKEMDINRNTDRMLKDNKVSFIFTYRDEKDVLINSINITPDEYK